MEFNKKNTDKTEYLTKQIARRKKFGKEKLPVYLNLYLLDYLFDMPAKAQASWRIRAAVQPEPSLVTHMKYGRRWSIRPKFRI